VHNALTNVYAIRPSEVYLLHEECELDRDNIKFDFGIDLDM